MTEEELNAIGLDILGSIKDIYINEESLALKFMTILDMAKIESRRKYIERKDS